MLRIVIQVRIVMLVVGKNGFLSSSLLLGQRAVEVLKSLSSHSGAE